MGKTSAYKTTAKAIAVMVVFGLFSSLANAQSSWWCEDGCCNCTGTYYCDVGAITPTAATQTITNGSFCAVAGGGGHTNNFDIGSSLWVRTSFVATASTTYCFGVIVTGSGFNNSTEIDIIGTSCGGAGNIIATNTGGTLPGGNETDNCLTWTSGATDGGKTFYIQYSDGPGTCYQFGSGGFETVYPTYRKGNCNCLNGKINPLPVELMDFTVSNCKNSSCVNLLWQTATELNNDYFTVERSTDGKDWTEIRKVKGAGNSSTILNYEFTDEELPLPAATATLYYRLRQTDYNGAYEYYGPVSVKLSPPDDWMLIIKNPAIDELKGTLLVTEDASVLLQICDLQGRLVKEEKLNAVKGSNMLKTELSNMEKGLYFIKVTDSNSNKQIIARFVRF